MREKSEIKSIVTGSGLDKDGALKVHVRLFICLCLDNLVGTVDITETWNTGKGLMVC